jgi:flagellar hook protein FlgE
MLRSMYSGVSGLRNHQVKLDVIGNNIANVNTISYKSSNITFQEVLGQTMQKATQPAEDGLGGTNPTSVGLGVSVGTIGVNHAEGSIQSTDNPNDLAIDGQGYFVVSDGMRTAYTRAGNFTTDTLGNLVTSTGEKVMGWNKGNRDSIDYSRPLEAINLANLSMESKETSELNFEGNFNSENDDPIDYNMTVYDSLGESHVITFTFTKDLTVTDGGEYNYEVSSSSDSIDVIEGDTTGNLPEGSIVFLDDGTLDIGAVVTEDINIEFNNGARDISIDANEINFNEEKTTYYSNSTSLTGNQDGYESGSLVGSGIDSSGNIVGNFSNGKDEAIATIALANFINSSGLEKAGNNSYVSTFNSGEAQVGRPGSGERGIIKANSLEMSNVDLAKEFTEMIVAQRGYQANSRVISTSDEMLQELVNLKR